MGHLFYDELSGTAGAPISTSGDPDLALFSNIQESLSGYWTGTPQGTGPRYLTFSFNDGVQASAVVSSNLYFWAVRGGDIACSGVATETVRLGVPPNPNVLLPGLTSGPTIGNTWDPFIDHTSFATGATLNFLGISTLAPINAPLAIGTLLIVPPPGPQVFLQTPGLPYAIPIPNDCALVGVTGVCQGGAITPGARAELTNALDLVLGTN